MQKGNTDTEEFSQNVMSHTKTDLSSKDTTENQHTKFWSDMKMEKEMMLMMHNELRTKFPVHRLG